MMQVPAEWYWLTCADADTLWGIIKRVALYAVASALILLGAHLAIKGGL
jgi:hypothetical protein